MTAIHFWSTDRLVVNRAGRWQVRDWPSFDLVADGLGIAYPELGGERLATVIDGRIRVDDRPVPIPENAPVRCVAWADHDHLVVVSGSNALAVLPGAHTPGPVVRTVPSHGPTAAVFGTHSHEAQQVWLIAVDSSDAPRRIYAADPLVTVTSVTVLADGRVALSVSRPPIFRSTGFKRIITIGSDGSIADLSPCTSGSLACPQLTCDGHVVAAYATSPTYPQWWLPAICRSDGMRPLLADRFRLASPDISTSRDGSRLCCRVFDGIRIGAVSTTLAGRWAWVVKPDGVVSDIAMCGPTDGAAIYSALGHQPALHRFNQDGLTPLEPVTRPAKTEIVTYRSDQGHELEALLCRPASSGRVPLVVWLAGGPHNGLDLRQETALAAWTSRGFAALAPDHRGRGTTGQQTMLEDLAGLREPAGVGAACDVLNAIDAAVELPDIDGDRVFAIGHSHGGFLINRLVTMHTRIRAAVAWEGHSDAALADALTWGGGGNLAVRGWFGGAPHEVPRQYAGASPTTDAGKVRTPLLLAVGEFGALTEELPWYRTLRDLGATVELVVYQGEGHTMSRAANMVDLYDRASDWFHRHEG